MARPIITLMTDFGDGSPYVAQMKGVILSINPDVHLVDISHSVRPQDVRQGALILADVTPHFPHNTIHVAVVDPGVGSSRELLCAKCGSLYLAPDNGLLTVTAQSKPPELIVAIEEREFWRSEISRTFHGRDILAPVAAHLSLGLSPQRLGPRRERLMHLAIPTPVQEENHVSGMVVLIDAFGNLITNIMASHLPSPLPRSLRIHCQQHRISSLTGTYAEAARDTVIALIGSSSRLEIAVVNGDAATQLQVGLNAPVLVDW